MQKIYATNESKQRELLPAGTYIARCYQMIHIGTVTENILGKEKTLNKIRIGWELPTELKVFDENKGEQPLVISKEFTLSLNEKSTLRQYLKNWRGKDFTEDEARKFDVTALIGASCVLNIIHKTAKNGNIYAEIGNISPMIKGSVCPPQFNASLVFSYEPFDERVFNSLPDFIIQKMKTSQEYRKLHEPSAIITDENLTVDDDLPF